MSSSSVMEGVIREIESWCFVPWLLSAVWGSEACATKSVLTHLFTHSLILGHLGPNAGSHMLAMFSTTKATFLLSPSS